MTSGSPGNGSEAIYEQRINAAMDFIETNLGQDLQLATVADAAGFSPYHFHRLFGALVGERLAAFVARRRTERAAALLIDQPTRTISAIGADCGFGTPSAFARAFKEFYGVTPGAWRSNGGSVGAASPPGGAAPGDASARFATPMPESDVTVNDGGGSWELRVGAIAPGRVTVGQLPEFDVAYLRHTGPFQGAAAVFGELFSRVGTWAGSVGIDMATTGTVALYHDDPNITDDELLRFSACVPIPATVVPEPPINRTTIGGGTYATAMFSLGEADYGHAWNGVLGTWLPQSGFEPDERQYFERFPPNPLLDDGRRSVEICVPVRPLTNAP